MLFNMIKSTEFRQKTFCINFFGFNLKPRLHMAHFKRTRPGTELARCLAPIRPCLHYRGRTPRQLDHQYAAALNFRHVVRALIAFLQFRRCHRGIRWLVCNNYENSNLKKFDVALFVNSRRHNSVDQLSPHCVVSIAFLY